MLAERNKERLFKDVLEDTRLPGKAITDPLSEVEYLGTSNIIRNGPSTNLRRVWYSSMSEHWLVFLKSEISFCRTVQYFMLCSQGKGHAFSYQAK